MIPWFSLVFVSHQFLSHTAIIVLTRNLTLLTQYSSHCEKGTCTCYQICLCNSILLLSTWHLYNSMLHTSIKHRYGNTLHITQIVLSFLFSKHFCVTYPDLITTDSIDVLKQIFWIWSLWSLLYYWFHITVVYHTGLLIIGWIFAGYAHKEQSCLAYYWRIRHSIPSHLTQY